MCVHAHVGMGACTHKVFVCEHMCRLNMVYIRAYRVCVCRVFWMCFPVETVCRYECEWWRPKHLCRLRCVNSEAGRCATMTGLWLGCL